MAILAETLLDRVAEIIPRYSMLSQGDRVGVAVSGGADSVVLLHVLHRLAPRLQIGLMVLHVNHGLRGAESDADEEFARELAASLGLEILAGSGTIGAGNLEQEARRVRTDFFKSCLAGHGLRRVALGHTRSDQAETVLFRLLRGSGLAGLAGMRFVTEEGIIRPLLTTSRDEVRQWAMKERISWREDSSNLDPQFARNQLRNAAIPALTRQFNPKLETVLAGVAELAQAEEDYWTEEIKGIYDGIAKRNDFGLILQVELLTALHPAVQRRVLRYAIGRVRGDLRSIDFAHVEAVRALCFSAHGHDRAIVPGIDALRSFDQLLLTQPGQLNAGAREYRINLELGVESELPLRVGSIFVSSENCGGENCVKVDKDQDFAVEVADLDADLLADGPGGLFVRNWEPGDGLRRAGHQKPEKIKSLFQQYKVLLWERRHWPVVVAGREIAWVRAFGSAAQFAASAGSRRVLRLVYRRGPERGS
jgi:tRNA(Ile)-lysidine synthase